MAKYYEHDLARWEGEGGGSGAHRHTPEAGTPATAVEKSIDRNRRPAGDLFPKGQGQNGSRRRSCGVPGRTALLVLVLVLCSPILNAQARSVWGVVTDRAGRPIQGAAVKLGDGATLQIRSFITQENGEYRFHRLHPDIDYTLRARFREQSSKTQTISRFNEKNTTRIDLQIDAIIAEETE